MKIFFIVIAVIIAFLALSWGLGWYGVFQTKTVGKAQQNADREVFEQTQSYVQAKHTALIKYHHEWMTANADDKLAIESTIRMDFASFDEEKYLVDYPDLYSFLKNIKNK